MSEWRWVWKIALHANDTLQKDRKKGEQLFSKLHTTYPNDGMVYYEQGEAFELLNEFELAKEGFLSAEKLFPVKHWKRVAHAGIDRVNMKISCNNYENSEFQWEIFHKIHTFKNLDLITKIDSLVAITLIDSEPHETALLFRCCLESIILTFLTDFDNVDKDIGLYEMINDLRNLFRRKNQQIPEEILGAMDKVRKIGNIAAHPRNRLSYQNFRECAHPYIRVAEWANIELEKRKDIKYFM
jgi:hypothetical protein